MGKMGREDGNTKSISPLFHRGIWIVWRHIPLPSTEVLGYFQETPMGLYHGFYRAKGYLQSKTKTEALE